MNGFNKVSKPFENTWSLEAMPATEGRVHWWFEVV